MDWDGLAREAEALRDDVSSTASGIAAQGAQLLHRALTEMYIGEPEPLRQIAFTIAEARPEVVAIRNVGVSAYRTAREARSGDRMAAAARSVARLARLLGDTPTSLAKRGQPLVPDGAIISTLGRSESVRTTIAAAGDTHQGIARIIQRTARFSVGPRWRRHRPARLHRVPGRRDDGGG